MTTFALIAVIITSTKSASVVLSTHPTKLECLHRRMVVTGELKEPQDLACVKVRIRTDLEEIQ